jgi:hypothetical protein
MENIRRSTMKRFSTVLMTLVFVLGLAASAFAADNGYSFSYEISKGAGGSLKLKITSTSPAAWPGLWMGVTLYTANPKDMPLNDAYQIKSGASTTEIDIDPKYINGTFEAAVYTKKINKSECDAKDEFCQKVGYRLSNRVAYAWRYIVNP